jgi:hypothetical protein
VISLTVSDSTQPPSAVRATLVMVTCQSQIHFDDSSLARAMAVSLFVALILYGKSTYKYRDGHTASAAIDGK